MSYDEKPLSISGNGGVSPVYRAFSHISWETGGVMSKLCLSSTDISLLKSVEANPLEYSVLSDVNDAKLYVKLLLKLISESLGTGGPSQKVSRLSLNSQLSETEAEEMLESDPMGVITHFSISMLLEVLSLVLQSNSKKVSILSLFQVNGNLSDDWRPLLRVLHLGGLGDAFSQRGAALCLAAIFLAACPSHGREQGCGVAPISFDSVEEPLQALISWIVSQLQSASAYLNLACAPLVYLMKSSEARLMFAKSGGIGYLSRHLRSGGKSTRQSTSKAFNSSMQQLYELSFCLWTITYECNTSGEVRSHFARDGAVSALVELIASSPREKVVRVALSSLRNLATCTVQGESDGKKTIDGSLFLSEMIGHGLIKLVDNLKNRQWTDPDIVEDLHILHKLLHENYKEMSSWDLYEAEVESGMLVWGILHTEKFMKENITRFEGKNSDFYQLKTLITLLSHVDDDVKAIACFDIGEFARHYPSGRNIAKRLGAKDIVMTLIDHENLEVQQQALSCISKILVQNWQYVQ